MAATRDTLHQHKGYTAKIACKVIDLRDLHVVKGFGRAMSNDISYRLTLNILVRNLRGF